MYYSIFSEQENIMNLYSMQEDFVAFHLSLGFSFKIYNYDKKMNQMAIFIVSVNRVILLRYTIFNSVIKC